jgi:uncharacterized protein (DUF1684 family)
VNIATAFSAENAPYADQIQKWRATREEKLRDANSWLSLVGRYPLKPGPNTFGTGKNNDVIFPASLAGLGPDRLGTLDVDPKAKKVTLKLSDGVSMTSGGKPFTGERFLGTRTDKRDWVSLGRLSMHIIARGGNYVLRLADNESPLRTHFPGCIWYPPDEVYKVEAKFVPYPAGRTLSIVNIIGESSQQPCPGYAEFQLHGQTHRLDAIAEDGGLFFVFRDATAGDTTYAASRFLDIAKQPQDNASFTLDFNKAYNPPCAFSTYTTCPLPPKQNILKTRIEAGEKYPGRHRERAARASISPKLN